MPMQTRASRTYDFRLTPNGVQQVAAVGNFVKVLGSNGRVRITTDTGYQLDALPGQGLRDIEFSSVWLEDISGGANAGTVMIGGAAMIDDRVTGTVDVVDGGRARTLAGTAFLGYGSINPSAGNAGVIQLWNPPASGRVAIVKQLLLSITAAGAVGVRFFNVAQAVNAGAYVVNKRNGGPASAMQCLVADANAAGLGTQNLLAAFLNANVSFSVSFAEPLILPPGTGLCANGPASAGNLATFDFIEEPA